MLSCRGLLSTMRRDLELRRLVDEPQLEHILRSDVDDPGLQMGAGDHQIVSVPVLR